MLTSSAQFVFQALRHPRKVGAVLPSSNRLGIAMASALNDAISDARSGESNAGKPSGVDLGQSCDLQIVELGPGTGQITRHLPTTNITLVEINHKFSQMLASTYPDATVFTGSAVEFFRQLKSPCAVVSSIPLLNNPEAGAIRDAVAQAYRQGLIKQLITYSYGSHSPFADCGFAVEKQVRFVALNLPPARVWLYA